MLSSLVSLPASRVSPALSSASISDTISDAASSALGACRQSSSASSTPPPANDEGSVGEEMPAPAPSDSSARPHRLGSSNARGPATAASSSAATRSAGDAAGRSIGSSAPGASSATAIPLGSAPRGLPVTINESVASRLSSPASSPGVPRRKSRSDSNAESKPVSPPMAASSASVLIAEVVLITNGSGSRRLPSPWRTALPGTSAAPAAAAALVLPM
mmetsp:Transcript_33781/g.87654  ORF Transcript_33781/g.87654 Transcript_33781/m.87654 type:complete len:217 (-) Transcript_33781:468-1118(-)